jgi:hypothetical protein
MKNNLPKYWVIKNEYPEVREYLSKIKDVDVTGWTNYPYIGLDGCKSHNGVHGSGWLSSFYNDAIEITYEQFLQFTNNYNNYEIY